MKSRFLTGAAAFLLLGDCVSHRLGEYHFPDLTAAAVMSAPPSASVASRMFIGIDPANPIGSAIRMGTSIARNASVNETRERLDQALASTDIPELIRQQVLDRSAEYLGYTPARECGTADLLFDMRIRNYGINAESWHGNVYFELSLDVDLLDTRKRSVIWSRRVHEYQGISSSWFGSGGPVGDIVSVVKLSGLREEELAAGFVSMAHYTVDQVIEKLKNNYYNSRR